MPRKSAVPRPESSLPSQADSAGAAASGPPRGKAATISLRGCRQHNLQGFDLEIPLGKLTVMTGPSGSGKSSLAFHTLYAEGQRRYVETFSPYVRQFFDRMDKPQVDGIDGIPPAIAIEQKNQVRTTRSTVGTLTEINDYLKLVFPRLATGHDPHTGEEIRPDTSESAVAWAFEHAAGEAAIVTFGVAVAVDTPGEEFLAFLNQQGYLRILTEAGGTIRTDQPSSEPLPVSEGRVQVVQDRVKVTPGNRARLLEAFERAFALGKGSAELVYPAETEGGPARQRHFTTAWVNPRTGFTLRAPTPQLFSFNNPLGACPHCRGFGRIIGLDLSRAVPDPTLSIAEGAIKPFQGERGDEGLRDLLRNCRERGIDIDVPWEELEEDVREWVNYGDRGRDKMETLDSAQLEELWQSGGWYGIKGFFQWIETWSYKMHVRIFLARYRSYTECPRCRGQRLQPEALCFRICGKFLPDLWSMPVNQLHAWFEAEVAPQVKARAGDPTLRLVATEVISRLRYLIEVGLGYLTLDRQTRTLSGGEVERVNLTTCLGAALNGTLFVLDEPTVGLHGRDVQRLIGIMHQLRDRGNTLVVVEHEHAVMHAADHLVDIGPGSGIYGGRLVYAGPADTRAPIASGTLPWLRGERSIAVPQTRRKPGRARLSIQGATRNNLRKLDLEVPLGLFVCLTGVSGSGKSTLAREVIFANLCIHFGLTSDLDAAAVRSITGWGALGGVAMVDQSPVARTPRSTPAVFLGAFDAIRKLFSETEQSRAAMLGPGFFSFNSGDGRCDRCAGNGFEKVEMQFLSDLYVVCPDCEGRRYKSSTLDVLLGGKSIAGVLDLTISEAIEFLRGLEHAGRHSLRQIQNAVAALEPLVRVGLAYLRLGQPLNTLSGGEAQRLKLCQLLIASDGQDPGAPGKLLILDEPTTGLHFSDIENLLGVFNQLVDAGHSLLVIEHNSDVIKSADWIIDLGPEAGIDGGKIVGNGPPEEIAGLDTATAEYLRPHLTGNIRKSGKKSAAKKSLVKGGRKSSAAVIDDGMIRLRGARHHNLKDISLDIPRDKLVVISGLSGSGKSTLAFDILFAEGQRRFLDSMSAYARQFAEQLEKPEIDQLQGLPPTVAIEQRVSQGGGKSTVATITEVWNFVRLLYSKLGTLHCPDCGVPVEKQSLAAIENVIRHHRKSGALTLMAPMVRGRKGYHTEVAEWANRRGYTKMFIDGAFQQTKRFRPLERFKVHDIDVVLAEIPAKGRDIYSNSGERTTLSKAIADALYLGKGLLRLVTAKNEMILLSTNSGCPNCNRSFDDLDPRLFSFNSPHGWCPGCRGYGKVPKRRFQLDASRYDSMLAAELDADRAVSRMDESDLVECPECSGVRLNPVAAAVRLAGTPIAELSQRTIDDSTAHFAKIRFVDRRSALIARDILPEIQQRLEFLREVGLGYLSMNRAGNTLSGGESQRIRLAAQLGSNLRGVLYVLDEPTIGLHPRDNAALLKTLTALRDHGNSLIIVEHDEDTIARADHLIDLGPGAGRLGGKVVYEGLPPTAADAEAAARKPATAGTKKRVKGAIEISPNLNEPWAEFLSGSPTLRALMHPLKHPLRGSRREIEAKHPMLELIGCNAHNLQNIDVQIPLGRLTVLTGISGSGKSTLMHKCIGVAAADGIVRPGKGREKAKNRPYRSATGFQDLKACYEVDQSPIGKTSRSCPATYVKVYDHVRALFAQLPEARIRGFTASRFSFNTEGGRCEDCKGNGRIKLEMDFLAPTWVHCETCNGMRYNSATLEVLFRAKNIGEVLAMTIDEAAQFFKAQPRISHPLELLADTGLGYLQLGQPSPTLSGGEAQRIKLVSELIRGRSAKARLDGATLKLRNLYLIEEPTVGLHHEDIRRLIEVLHRLVEEGHTVIVIEHHMAIAAEADWILDLGPEAGQNGGEIIAKGTPEQVARSKTSRTAPYLKRQLEQG